MGVIQGELLAHIDYVRTVYCAEGYDVYIGRPSKWGNPFVIGKDGLRDEVIQKYREWIQGQPQLLAALGELRGKFLGCYCRPAACRGDILSELANRRFQ